MGYLLTLLTIVTFISSKIHSNDFPSLQEILVKKIYQTLTKEYPESILHEIKQLNLPNHFTRTLISKAAHDDVLSLNKRIMIFLTEIYRLGKKNQWHEVSQLVSVLYSSLKKENNTSPVNKLITYLSSKDYFHKNFFIIFHTCAKLAKHNDETLCTNGSLIKDAIIHNNDRLLSYLIKANFNILQHDRKGYTPLLWACRNGREKCLQLLINAGANPQDRTNHPNAHHYVTTQPKSALELTEHYCHDSCKALLLESQRNHDL